MQAEPPAGGTDRHRRAARDAVLGELGRNRRALLGAGGQGRELRAKLSLGGCLLQAADGAEEHVRRAERLADIADHHDRAVVGIAAQPVEQVDPRQALPEEDLAELALADEVLDRPDRRRDGPRVRHVLALPGAVLVEALLPLAGPRCDVSAEDAHRPVIAAGAVGGHHGGEAVVRVGRPALGVPYLHPPVFVLAVDPLAVRGRRVHALVMDRADVQPLEEVRPAVGEELVPRVGGGVAAADEDLDARVLPGPLDAPGHPRVQRAVADHVRPPAGDAQALPRLVPQREGRDRPLRPAVPARHRRHPVLEVVVLLRQPGEVLLAAEEHGLVVQVWPTPAERLRAMTRADHEQDGDLVGLEVLELLVQLDRPPVVVLLVGGDVRPAHADGLNAQAAEDVVRQVVERHLGVLDAVRLGLERPHAARREPPPELAQVHHKRVRALALGDSRRHRHVGEAPCLDVRADGDGLHVGDLVHVRLPDVARDALRAVGDHVDLAGRLDWPILVIDDLERERRLLARPKDVARHGAVDHHHAIRIRSQVQRNAERLGIPPHLLAGLHLRRRSRRNGKQTPRRRNRCPCRLHVVAFLGEKRLTRVSCIIPARATVKGHAGRAQAPATGDTGNPWDATHGLGRLP